MNNYYEVLSNLSLDGQQYKAGSVIQGGGALYDGLVADGTLRALEATTQEAAEEEAAEYRAAAAAAAEEGGEAPAAKDTWAPTEEEQPEAPAEAPGEQAAAPDAANAPAAPVLKKYIVQADNGIQLEGAPDKTYAKGEAVELDPESPQALFFVKNGIVAEDAPAPGAGDNL